MTTSSQQIKRLFSRNSNFLGVVANNQLTTLAPLQVNQCLIANLQNSDQSGSHWVGAYHSPEVGIVYIDTFGWPPTIQMVNYLDRSGGFHFMDIQFQRLEGRGADYCGEFQVWFTDHFLKGKFIQGLTELDWHPSRFNDFTVLSLFNSLQRNTCFPLRKYIRFC